MLNVINVIKNFMQSLVISNLAMENIVQENAKLKHQKKGDMLNAILVKKKFGACQNL